MPSIGAMTQPLSDVDLATLVPEWLDWDGAAQQLGITPSRVRVLVKEHRLAAAVPRSGGKPSVPADFVQDGEIVKGLAGLLTMMHDNGFDDRECIAWLFLDQELPGRPIDALRENRGAEVKRRAQAMA